MKRVFAAAAAAVLALSVAPTQALASAHQHEARACRPSLAAGTHTLTITSSGRDRTVVVHIPSRTVRHDGRVPLVLTLHGSGSNAVEQLARSGLDAAADGSGFIAVAPQGYLGGGGAYAWFVPHINAGADPNDEQFLLDTIAELSRTACGDPSRVYATGYSGGGRMVSAFACDHADSVAAIVPVAGLRAGAPMKDAAGAFTPDPSTCRPSRPVPVLTFAGTADPVNPFAGGGAAYWGYGTAAALGRWATLNKCRRTPTTTQVSEHVTRIAYSACRAHADVVAYVVDGGGHTWPGSQATWPSQLGVVTQEISADAIAWAFVRTRHS